MSETTRAPWRACTDRANLPQLLYSGVITTLHHSPDPDGYVAVVTDWGCVGDDHGMLAECQANAHLIASAPDLLAALEALAEPFPSGNHPCWCPWTAFSDSDVHHLGRCLQARAAIQKATGGQPAPLPAGG